MRRCRLAVCAALAVAATALGILPFPPAARAAASSATITFPRLIQPTVQLNPATIEYDHPTVTFAGQVTAGVAFQTVHLTSSSGPAYNTTTDSTGEFSVAAPGAMPGQVYQAEVDPTSTTAGAISPSITVTEVVDAVKVTAKLGHATIKYGQTDTISGTVTYQSAPLGPFSALPGTPVAIALISPPGQPPIEAVTKADGTFTASIPAQHATGSWTVSAGGPPLLDPATTKLTLNVQLPTDFRQVKIGLSAFRVLSVKACLNITSPGGHPPIDASITLQYARSAKGPWKTLRTIKPTAGIAYCSGGSPLWQATVGAPLANAYYRVSFAGDSGLQAAASPAVHRWRRLTKITSFSISPHRVPAMGAVTVKGRLWHHTAAWHPYAGHKVVILFKYKGEWFFYENEPRTNSRGYFSGRFTVYVTSPWIAQFDGDRTDFGSASKRIDLTVTSVAGLSGPAPCSLRGKACAGRAVSTTSAGLANSVPRSSGSSRG